MFRCIININISFPVFFNVCLQQVTGSSIPIPFIHIGLSILKDIDPLIFSQMLINQRFIGSTTIASPLKGLDGSFINSDMQSHLQNIK